MRIAAIDIGSNSIHMIVCRIREDLSFEVVDREKDMIRLAAGTLTKGFMPDTNIATAMQTLAKFKRLAESHDVEEILVAATRRSWISRCSTRMAWGIPISPMTTVRIRVEATRRTRPRL